MLKDINLQLSRTLSEGEKRKLFVAIVMIRSLKIVLLDEPSSYMDTTARRNMWETLKKIRTVKLLFIPLII
jgi:ABC-type multidrug transport system ATPase subunit